MLELINLTSWKVCLVLLLIVFFILWLVCGRDKSHKFIGLSFLDPPAVPVSDNQDFERIPTYNERQLNLSSSPSRRRQRLRAIPEETYRYIENEESDKSTLSVLSRADSCDSRAESLNNICYRSIGEQITHRAASTILGRQLVRNLRPTFLCNPLTNRNMELDVYDPQEKIAFEYMGEQHYKYPNCFHREEKDFLGQIYRDELKRKLCDQNGIYLITIPYTVDKGCKNNVERYERISAFIDEQMKALTCN